MASDDKGVGVDYAGANDADASLLREALGQVMLHVEPAVIRSKDTMTLSDYLRTHEARNENQHGNPPSNVCDRCGQSIPAKTHNDDQRASDEFQTSQSRAPVTSTPKEVTGGDYGAPSEATATHEPPGLPVPHAHFGAVLTPIAAKDQEAALGLECVGWGDPDAPDDNDQPVTNTSADAWDPEVKLTLRGDAPKVKYPLSSDDLARNITYVRERERPGKCLSRRRSLLLGD